jgi:hypothetical protein
MAWTTNLHLKFLLHVSARVGYNQRQHVGYEAEITKGIKLQTVVLSQLASYSINVYEYSINMLHTKFHFS